MLTKITTVNGIRLPLLAKPNQKNQLLAKTTSQMPTHAVMTRSVSGIARKILARLKRLDVQNTGVNLCAIKIPNIASGLTEFAKGSMNEHPGLTSDGVFDALSFGQNKSEADPWHTPLSTVVGWHASCRAAAYDDETRHEDQLET